MWDARTGAMLFDFRASGPCCALGDGILVYSLDGAELRAYRRIRPEYWWGVFYLRHFWVIVVLSLALALSAWKDVRDLRRARAG